jgi:hypothetical protein
MGCLTQQSVSDEYWKKRLGHSATEVAMKKSGKSLFPWVIFLSVCVVAAIWWLYHMPNLDFVNRATFDMSNCKLDAEGAARAFKQRALLNQWDPRVLDDAKQLYDHARGRIANCISVLDMEIDIGISDQRAREIGDDLQGAYNEVIDFKTWCSGPTAQAQAQPGPPGGAGPVFKDETATPTDTIEAFKGLVKFLIDTRREVQKPTLDKLKAKLQEQNWTEFEMLN